MARPVAGAGARADSNYRLTYVVLTTPVVAFALLQSLVIPVLPTIQAALHTTQNHVSWVLTAYLLSASVLTPIIGRMGDMWGKKRVLVMAIVALAAGCALSALAGSLPVMLVGRVISGCGGGIIPLAFGIFREELPKDKIPGAVGFVSSVAAAGVGLGLVLAGPIVHNLSYRWLFWTPMLLLVATALAAYLIVPESRSRAPSGISWSAGVLLAAWLVALLLGVSEGPTWGWASGPVLGLLVAAVVLAGAWMAVETRSDHPLIDMRMMRIPVVWTANLVALLIGVGMYSFFAFVPQVLQSPRSTGYGFGASITESGLLMLPNSAGAFIVGALCGRLAVRFGAKALLLGGTVVNVLPLVLLVVARDQKWEIVLSTGGVGIGMGLAFAAMSALIVEGVPVDQTGVASGMNANIRTIGGSVGIALMTSVITGSAHGAALPTDHGYTLGFLVPAVAALVAVAAAVLVPSGLRAPTTEELEEAHLHPELGLLPGGTLVGEDPE